MIAYFAYAPIPTPTHAQALLGLAMLAACLPTLIWFASALARMRPRKGSDVVEGVCGRCGYNLQGLPGTICPECGADTSEVGTRRPVRNFARGTWTACILWLALLLALNSYFKVNIERYMLRLVWQETSFSRWWPQNHPTKPLRLATLAILMAVGVAIIIWFSRRRVTQTLREA